MKSPMANFRGEAVMGRLDRPRIIVSGGVCGGLALWWVVELGEIFFDWVACEDVGVLVDGREVFGGVGVGWGYWFEESILEEAQRVTAGMTGRARTVGPLPNHERIARLWNAQVA